MSLYDGSNEAAILEALSGRLAVAGHRVRCEIGEEEDARRGEPPRIVWIWQSERYRAPTQQRAGMQVAHDREPLFDVHIWGADYERARLLRDALEAALFVHVSPNGYEFGEARRSGSAVSPGEKGFEIVLGVRLLRIPVPAVIRRTVAVTKADASGEVAGALGEEPKDTGPAIRVFY